MPITPVKNVQTALIAWQDVATATAPRTLSPFYLDVSTLWSARFGIKLGRQSASNFTAGWPIARVDGSTNTSPGSGDWIPLFSYPMGAGSSVAKTTLNGAVSAADTTFVVTSASGLAIGNLCFMGHSSVANYELIEILGISGTTITPKYPVQYAHASGATFSNQAEWSAASVSLKEIMAVRGLIDNANGGQTVSAEISMISFSSY